MVYKRDWETKAEAANRKRIDSMLKAHAVRCAYCGRKFHSISEKTIDHLRPRCHGIIEDADNKVVVCQPCNIAKGDMRFKAFKKLINFDNLKNYLMDFGTLQMHTGSYYVLGIANKFELTEWAKREVLKRGPMELFRFQKDMLNDLWESLQINNKVLACAPTGAGKTVMASSFIDFVVREGMRVGFVVDREELIKQSYETFNKTNVSIIKAGYNEYFSVAKPIQLIMIQSYHGWREELPDLELDFIIVDEVHNNWNTGRIVELLKKNESAKVIGLSATPITPKGWLLDGFDDYIEGPQIKELIKLGRLCQPVDYVFESYGLDLTKVGVSGGDYSTEEVDEQVLDLTKVEMIADEWERLASDRKTLVFANSIKHAELICAEFQKRGHAFELVHSKNNNRDAVEKIKAGTVQGLVNVSILIAGFDCPSIDCIIDARPTRLLRVTTQLRGRGLRPAPNKKDCLILDFAGAVERFGNTDDHRFYAPKPEAKNEQEYKECPECGAIVGYYQKECEICGYEFDLEAEERGPAKKTKKQLERLVKIKSMQDEAYNEIKALVKARGHKAGYSWHLFRGILTKSKNNGRGIAFYKSILTKIDKCKNSVTKSWYDNNGVFHEGGKPYSLQWLLR